jgi:hypothetical protein
MIRKLSTAFVAIILATTAIANEPKELEAARREYEQSVPHGSEVARTRYVTKLAAIVHGFVKEYRKTGVPKNADYVGAINAELRRHPAPADSDSKKLSQLLAGKWESPRHEYLFRKDGTYSMLPLEEGAAHGRWRIEGNQYIENSATEPPRVSRYTLILLNAEYFVFSDKDGVFFEARMSK